MVSDNLLFLSLLFLFSFFLYLSLGYISFLLICGFLLGYIIVTIIYERGHQKKINGVGGKP